MLGQMLPRVGAAASVEPPYSLGAWAAAAPAERSPMSSTGITTSTSRGLPIPASTMVTGRGSLGAEYPPRKRATSSSGRCVAESPMRCGGRSVTASRRSSESARWAPRLVGARAWISSTITVSTPASVSAADDVSIR